MPNKELSKCCGAKRGIVRDAPAISYIKIGDEVCTKCFAPFVLAEEVVIARPVYYNKFSQYICDKNDIPLMELVGEDDSVGQFISEAINNFK